MAIHEEPTSASGHGGLYADHNAKLGKPHAHLAIDVGGDFGYASDVALGMRLAFIRKVYAVLCTQLAFTIALVGVTMLPSAHEFLLHNRWLFTVSTLASFVLLFALHVKKNDSPANLYLLAAWTTSLAMVLSQAVMYVPALIVLQALGLTLVTVAGLTVYTFQSRKDFSFLGGALFTCLWALIFTGIFRIFFPVGPLAHTLLSLFGCVLFALFIIYDTSLIIRNYTVDDWVPAVISLYLDIANLFLHILRILSSISRQD
eukprot:TRINITY_DN5362_c0_g1_i1.p2 TRINITY_DN5362_c0_g1~~TRINITY_DN5362_c0_g1_i1.p2  ORF type:complete len:285 (-),score=76.28 TRINITY_DN5362_c0_g1_i1:140-916(-)